MRIAKLNLSLHGTRDAAQKCAAEYTGYLVSIGFEAGKATPCDFKHATREIFVWVHGDDFTVIGPDEELKWMEGQLKARYDIKSEFLGPNAHHRQEIRVLNRSIRWTQHGLEYEPD
jgi:hypothetical protein